MSITNRTIIYAANTAELKDEYLYHASYRRVTDERKKKVDSLCLPRDKRLSLGAELILLHGLRARNINSTEIKYRYGEKGKPYLVGESGVYFNLSHADEMVICAVSFLEIGCDVEKITNLKGEIARRFFDGREYEWIADQKTEMLQREMFFRLWTLKESFIKATGRGLSQPMNSFCIRFNREGLLENLKYQNETYYFQEINLCENYKCAVCGLDKNISAKNGVLLERLNFRDELNS
ncbi:MAG: 4'-phosphopantetheinyl transferase superfamily protein [Clostridiaceae bacterium]|nr:4'-phosphopantetheinyl transferase superfamily protein [Clostridiaceae bacterium]